MPSKDPIRQPIELIKSSINSIYSNPIILYPFTIIAFIQILILEFIFFTPRFPLSVFFGPLVKRLEGEIFLHYPFNFIILNKWFQQAQIPVFIFISSFFMGMAIKIIFLVNGENKIKFKNIMRELFKSYIHLVIGAFISILFIIIFGKFYGLIFKRALIIRSTSGIFFLIKQIVLIGAPYFNLIFAIIINTLFAFVFPIIILERKKIFPALIMNFKMVVKSFWFILSIVFLSSMLYLPILVLKTNSRLFQEILIPESWGFLLVISIVVSLFIDALQYTAITTFYLLKKEL